MKLILGSQSTGRRQVLDKAGYTYVTMPADIDEKAIRHDDLNVLPLLVARAKAAALVPRIKEPAILITADSIAVWHGELREKPEDEAQAREYIRSYSDDAVGNITGLVVTNTATGQQLEGVETATTHFKKIPEAAIEALIADGFILQTAGAYAVEHPLMAPYVERIDGEVSCVTGLPLGLLEQLLDKLDPE